MFRGVSTLSLDPKGRLVMPARYREQLQSCCASHLVVTIDPDRCLLIYPEPNWKEIERKLERLPSFNPTARKLQRLYIGHAHDVDMDAQGRLQLPTELRQFANLDKRVALVGQSNKFELWDEDTWAARRDQWLNEEDLAQLESSAEFASLSI
ncbi:MAG: division/cell wall cluster transcriptional repressor MraZ [Chromatiaceae bacterium]|nr:division/cell wall cluster transcriptional repressor MraZ [Chromatiaceae bacterium]MBP8024608.1 division/cell wall cluster transcriptional repressor MraZ [Chromatiaceae bacterium]MBP9605226.1 division/cell wall cluster transcriptional repressor MraZ [Chromatiaceae bacterium]